MSAERIAGAGNTPAAETAATKSGQRAELARLAAEFESLMLANMLRDMRAAGRWAEEDSSNMLGAGAFGQTFDTELARNLSQGGGFGLSSFLLKAFDRYASTGRESARPAPAANGGLAGDAGAPTPVEQTLSVAANQVTSAFGWRKDPLTGALAFHRGIDLKASEGDPVAATAAGRVVFSGVNGGYGTSVVVEHANGVATRYAHLSEASVAAGDQVHQGQTIGKAGHTGRATGTHLHYEVLAGGKPVDPLR